MAVHPPGRTMETHLASCRVHGHGPAGTRTAFRPRPTAWRRELTWPSGALTGTADACRRQFCTVQDDRSWVGLARCKIRSPAWPSRGKPGPGRPALHGARSACRGDLAPCKPGAPGSVLHRARSARRARSGRAGCAAIGAAFARSKIRSPADLARCKRADPVTVLHRASGLLPAAPGSVLHRARSAGRADLAPYKTDPGAVVLHRAKPTRGRLGSEILHRAKPTQERPACTVQYRRPEAILHRAKGAREGSSSEPAGVGVGGVVGPGRSGRGHRRPGGRERERVTPWERAQAGSICTVQNRVARLDLHRARGRFRGNLARCKTGRSRVAISMISAPSGRRWQRIKTGPLDAVLHGARRGRLRRRTGTPCPRRSSVF